MTLPRRVTLVAMPSMASDPARVTLPRLPWEPDETGPDMRAETRPIRAMPTQPARPALALPGERVRRLQLALNDLRDEVQEVRL
jgi:hypothetical protein